MFDSLGKRILIINSILFAGAVLLTNVLSWHFLKDRLREEQRISFQIAKQQIINILKEANFRYSLAKLKTNLNPKELLILEQQKAIQQIEKISQETGIIFLIFQGKQLIKSNTSIKDIDELRKRSKFISFYFAPFQWKIYLGFPQNTFILKTQKTLTIYLTSLLFLITASILLTYLFYKRWLDNPIKEVMESLKKGQPLQKTGIKEIDLLIEGINSALEREKQLLSNIAFTEKMSALGVLAGGYAHEFNNLLQIISGHLKLAQVWLDKNDSQKVRDKLQKAEEAAIRGAEISQRILRLARKEIPTKTKVASLDKVIHNTLEALQKAFPKGIKFTIQCQKNLFVPLKEDELQEIILNICLNARDAMGEKGELIIKAREQKESILLTIEDTGPGIPENIKNRLFEPFFTTKETGKGTGLGLFVVHQLVTEAGGKIHIENREQGGAKFTIEFPKIESPQISEENDYNSPTNKDDICKVLIVDDEEEIISNLKEFLEMEGFIVETATTAEEAYTKLKNNPTDYQLLLVDLVMPSRGGDWLLEKIHKENLGKYFIILITGFAGEFTDKILSLKKEGKIHKVLRKPFSLAEIKSILYKEIKCKRIQK